MICVADQCTIPKDKFSFQIEWYDACSIYTCTYVVYIIYT